MVSNPIIDNSPVSIIEGMALGMCVITTAVGGVPFIFEDEKNALFVENNDAKGLADKISLLLNSKEMEQDLSKNGREVAEKYDWGQVQELWKSVLINKED